MVFLWFSYGFPQRLRVTCQVGIRSGSVGWAPQHAATALVVPGVRIPPLIAELHLEVSSEEFTQSEFIGKTIGKP